MPSLRYVLKGLAFSSFVLLSSAAPIQDACGPVKPGPPPPAPPGPPGPPKPPAPPAPIKISTISTGVVTVSPTSTKAAIVATTTSSSATKAASASATPTIPASGSIPDLNSTTLSLAYVAIGRGIQNYTCTQIGQKGAAIGAIATLYDATSLAYSDAAMLHTLPAQAVNMPEAKAGNYKTAAKALDLPVLGNHYFDFNGTPTFNLSAKSKMLFAGKKEAVNAPANADKGPSGTGAVQWLMLLAKPDYAYGTSVGLGEVYRIETAGGNSPLCTEASGVITVDYAAEYWFYA